MSTLNAASSPNLLNIPVKDIAGKDTTLAGFGGKAVLVVNVASQCGYTRQY
ncbi:MAG: glutathione peroxidase, partial [Verrucomicrobiota bacterium]